MVVADETTGYDGSPKSLLLLGFGTVVTGEAILGSNTVSCKLHINLDGELASFEV